MAEFTYELPTGGEARNLSDAKIKTALSSLKTGLNGNVDNTNLAAAAKPFDWYTPKVIATEQTRESTSFGTLTTADEIKEVVLPENGLIGIGYMAKVKSSVGNNGRIAIFVGANQLKTVANKGPEVQEVSSTATTFRQLSTYTGGVVLATEESGADVTTGQTIGLGNFGGLSLIFAAAGTYNISVQYKAVSGNVTAKERKLWCCVLGV